MRWYLERSVVMCSVVCLPFAAGACGDDPQGPSPTPIEQQLSAKPLGCDFGSMAQDAKSYFPGTGKGSINNNVQELIKLMQSDCAAGGQGAYTGHWFEITAILEGVLETGTGGSPVAGGSFLSRSVTVVGPDGLTPIFNPCGTSAAGGCVSWDGYPALPDFTGVLASADGAWAVPSLTGSETVCSSFIHQCDLPTEEVWGVSPETTWGDAFYDRPTVVFGQPLASGSPTGETLLNSLLASYDWLIIPHVDDGFGSLEIVEGQPTLVESSLEVGLCSAAQAAQEAVVQKGHTILTEVALPWCSLQVLDAGLPPSSAWGRLLAYLTPTPTPLMATVAGAGPGGSAGGFTDFHGVDIPNAAVLELPSPPAPAKVGEVVMGQDGQPLRVLTYTSSVGSPIEDALITVTILGNNGLVPSGNDVSASGLQCTNFVCTGFTDADEEANPGTLLLPLVFTKPGQYSLCITAELAPLIFNQACDAEKFTVTP